MKLQQLSSTSAEYVGQAEASREGLSLRNTFHEVLLPNFTTAEASSATVIRADNSGAICLANNPIAHARHKHTSLKFHFVRELIKKNLIRFEWISTVDNLADILTKPLSKLQFRKLRTKLMGNKFVYPELIRKRKLGQYPKFSLQQLHVVGRVDIYVFSHVFYNTYSLVMTTFVV
jgi:hypothetical protein